MSLKEDDPLGLLAEALTVGSDRAIRNQEKRGQDGFVRSTLLPSRVNHGSREQFEAMGIVFGDPVEDDDLFVHAELPEGWKKEPTDHSMWSNLVDDQGRKRASIFYKAAFYDRDAFLSIARRFTYRSQPLNGDYDAPPETTPREGVVLDGEEVIWRTDPVEPSESLPWYKISDIVRPKAKAWLEEHYPEWRDPLAYWDEER